MSTGRRWGLSAGIFAIAAALIAWFFTWALGFPPTSTASAASGGTNLELQTVGSIGYGPHPTWVSYLVKNHGTWEHTTIFQLPANSTIHVTLLEYDSQGPLRNYEVGLPLGVKEYVDGKPLVVSNAGGNNAPGHTFTVPALGVNVPLVGPPTKDNNNLCAVAPCHRKSPHTTITFTLHTKGPGNYRWQCFVPCGLSYFTGNGGPMSTLGYMGGFLKVVA